MGKLEAELAAERAKLEALTADLLERTKQPCLDAMKDAGVGPGDVKEVRRGKREESFDVFENFSLSSSSTSTSSTFFFLHSPLFISFLDYLSRSSSSEA